MTYCLIETVDVDHKYKFFYKFDEKRENIVRREWLILSEDRLFCIYCLCFSENSSNNLCNANGLEFLQNTHISEVVKRHEGTRNHLVASNKYLRLRYGYNNLEEIECGEFSEVARNRYIVARIIKIILYIATHGTLCLTFHISHYIRKHSGYLIVLSSCS